MTEHAENNARIMRLWRRRTLIFSACIIGLFVIVLLVFGLDDGTDSARTLPLPVSLAGLLLVYALYAYCDLLWVRKNHHTLNDKGSRNRGDT